MSTLITLQVFADIEVFEDGSMIMTIDPKGVDTEFILEDIYEDKDDDEVERITAAVAKIQEAQQNWTGSPIKVEFA